MANITSLTAIGRLVEQRPGTVLRATGWTLLVCGILGSSVMGTIMSDGMGAVASDLARAQLIAGVLSLAVLMIGLGGAVRASLPLAVGAVGLIAGMGILRLIAQVTAVAPVTASLVAFLTITLAVPYTLYVLSRFREELAAGYVAPDAASRAVLTAGRTVGFGAMTLVLSIAGLLVLPSPELRGTAVAAIAAVVCAAVAAVIVLPAALAVLGVRVDRLSRSRGGAAGSWWGRVSARLAGLPIVVGLVIGVLMLLAGTPFLGVELTMASDGMTTQAVAGRAPLAIAIVLLGSFIVLVLELGSLAVPAKAVLLNLLTLCPSFGVLVLIFQNGNLQSVFGMTGDDTVDVRVAVVLFCVAFGVAMESQVYVLSRIKEEFDRTGDPVASVAEGIGRARGILDVAAWGVVAVLIGFLTTRAVLVTELTLGLTLVVALQATVARAVVLPALMRLAPAANWRTPEFLRRAHDRLSLTQQVAIEEAPKVATSRPARKLRPAKPARTAPTATPAAAPGSAASGSAASTTRKVGEYQLAQSLGRDHHSETFVAEDPTGDQVALRLFDDINVPADLVRASVVLGRYASMQSAHLVRVHNVGLWEGHLYYAMEFYPLGSLAAASPSVSSSAKIAALADAARGMQALHDGRMLHRDLRPQTVLLHPDGGRLAGLGLVELLAEETRNLSAAASRDDAHHSPINDPAHVSQTVLRGGEATIESELFAIGATLHEVLTGQSVYGDLPQDPVARRAHVLGATVTVSPTLSESAATVVRRCISTDDPNRFTTASQAADAMAPLLVDADAS